MAKGPELKVKVLSSEKMVAYLRVNSKLEDAEVREQVADVYAPFKRSEDKHGHTQDKQEVGQG